MENILDVADDFDGVFYFTNASDEDYEHLWNNEKYVFPAKTTCPMIMPRETLENIQAIRKRFAKDFAIREFYKGKEYLKMSKQGGITPATYDEDSVLAPWIQQCLQPLPKTKAKVLKMPKEDEKVYKASKAVGDKDNLAEKFKDDMPEELGVMPE